MHGRGAGRSPENLEGGTALPGRDFALKKCFALRRKADNAMHSFLQRLHM